MTTSSTPISTKSYYSMAGIFKSTYTMEHYNIVADWHEREVGTASARWRH